MSQIPADPLSNLPDPSLYEVAPQPTGVPSPVALSPAPAPAPVGLEAPAKRGANLGTVRVAWAAVMMAVLALVWITGAPVDGDNGRALDWAAHLSVAESNQSANNLLAEGAPQQQVVNGWHTNEVLAINTAQLGSISANSARSAAMLGVVGLAFLGDLMIRGFTDRRRDRYAPSTNH